MAGDWVKLHRKLLGHPIMSQDGLCRLWIHCMLQANWKDSTWLIPGTGRAIDIKRGSFITGRSSLHKQLYSSVDHREIEKPSESTLWRRLQTLEQLGCVKLENVNNRCTTVTICNYESYQSSDESIRTTDDQPVNNQRTTDDQPVNTDKEGKNLRREEGKKNVVPVGQNGHLMKAKGKAETWLTDYGDLWMGTFGGLMPYDKFAASLKTLEKLHGHEEVVIRWGRYCEANRGNGEYASAAKFSQTFGQWSDDPKYQPASTSRQPVKPKVRPIDNSIDKAFENMR